MVPPICFLSDTPKAFSEVHRILIPKGVILLGVIDKNTVLRKKYEMEKSENKFYRDAHFYSPQEIAELIKQAGFHHFSYLQTLTKSKVIEIEQPQQGFGKGSFVVMKAINN